MKTIKIIEPNPLLKDYINYFWTFDADKYDNEKIEFKVLADGLPGMIFQHFGGESVVEEVNCLKLPTSFVYGQATKSFTNFSQQKACMIGVSLKPHILPLLFRTDAFEFTNRLFPLNDLAGYDINDQLLNAPDQSTRVDILSKFLLNKISVKKGADAMLKDCINNMGANTENLNIASLLKYYSVSERHFERKFRVNGQKVGYEWL